MKDLLQKTSKDFRGGIVLGVKFGVQDRYQNVQKELKGLGDDPNCLLEMCSNSPGPSIHWVMA